MLIVCIGPPLSGKSTWAQRQGLPIISCDLIRLELSGNPKKYKFDPKIEKRVWDMFYSCLIVHSHGDYIIDNTNCKIEYLNKIADINADIQIKIFDVPFWKLFIRNYIRYVSTGKWIPIKVLRQMHKNFKKLKADNFGDYHQYYG